MDSSQRHFAVILLVLAAAILALIAFRAGSSPGSDGRVTPLPSAKKDGPPASILSIGRMSITLPSTYAQLFREPFHGLVSYRFRGPERRSLTVKQYKSGREKMRDVYDEMAANPKDPRRKRYLGDGKITLETSLGNETVSGHQFVIDHEGVREWLMLFFPKAGGEEFYELRFLTAADKAAADEVKSILRGLVFGPSERP